MVRLFLPQGAKRGLTVFALVLGLGVFTPELVIAQGRNDSELIVRVQALEESVRALTGQVEDLQHTIQVLKEQLAKQQEDNEFRFQQLEGGAGKKPKAATKSSGGTPAVESPQASAAIDPNALPAPTPLEPESNSTDSGAVTPADGLGDSADPLVGSNQAGGGTLGTLGTDGAQPLDLSAGTSQALSDGDAAAQYQAADDAIKHGDYAFAEDQLRQFIALYPDDPQAPDAVNWLGEALIQQQKFDDAADVLSLGAEKYPRSARTPDILVRLGIAFAGAGQADGACRTFFEVSRRFTKQPPAFVQWLKSEQAKAQCAVQ
jgi:tol-pal system protein YbgF